MDILIFSIWSSAFLCYLKRIDIITLNELLRSTKLLAYPVVCLQTKKSTKANATKQKLVTLKPGVTKMRIYMWIEGQDIDCYTGASGTYLNWDLQFQVDTVAST